MDCDTYVIGERSMTRTGYRKVLRHFISAPILVCLLSTAVGYQLFHTSVESWGLRCQRKRLFVCAIFQYTLKIAFVLHEKPKSLKGRVYVFMYMYVLGWALYILIKVLAKHVTQQSDVILCCHRTLITVMWWFGGLVLYLLFPDPPHVCFENDSTHFSLFF